MVLDTQEAPSWLDEDFLTKSLREGLDEPDLQISLFDIKPATARGDNYASIMYRIALELTKTPDDEPQRMSFVCKTLPPGDKARELMKDNSMFGNEAHVLISIIPTINKLLQEVIPGQKPLAAKCILFTEEPEEVLILEDLKELGFELQDRMSGLDMDKTFTALEAFAKFHAGSLMLMEKYPEKIENCIENKWHNSKHISEITTLGLASLIDEAGEFDYITPDQIERLQGLQDSILEKLDDALSFDESFVNVLLHGDGWINNMMFAMEDDVQGIRLVDFQMCCISSMVLDLNYFIFTTPNLDIRIAKIEEMLQFYYDTFMDTVMKLGVQLPREFTFEDLKEEFHKRAFFGLFAAIVVYPITVIDCEDVMDLNDFFKKGDGKGKMYRNEEFQKGFKLMLSYFIDNGVI